LNPDAIFQETVNKEAHLQRCQLARRLPLAALAGAGARLAAAAAVPLPLGARRRRHTWRRNAVGLLCY